MIRSARNFLFLQGPPGPFFRELGDALRARGAGVRRINFSGGDHRNWPEADNYRGLLRDWPLYFDEYIQRHAITDVVLYGDCRPVHFRVTRLARLRGVHIHVFEEGYIRPNWMTLERDGVNGHSRFDRDPAAILAAAETLPPIPDLPPITASFARRARDSFWYSYHVAAGRIFLQFPFYSSHRTVPIPGEFVGWLIRWARLKRRVRQAAETLAALAGERYFLVPLQLSGDYQIRAHSPFLSMSMALDYILASFARHAPADAKLLVKEHPLDISYGSWRWHIARRARHYGVPGRVFHIDGGDLQELCTGSVGMVCVNSTSGTLALSAGTPVIVLGDAVYDVPGVTHQGPLDRFWSDPEIPDMTLYEAFRTVLHAECLVRGGLASESATRILVANSVERLLAAPDRPAG